MQFRTHPKMKWEGFSNWPPAWGGSYGRGDIFPVGEEGVLIDVEMAEADNTMPRHLTKRSNTAGTPRRGCSAAMMMRRSSLASSRFSKAASAGR
jgi:hypothetical protein